MASKIRHQACDDRLTGPDTPHHVMGRTRGLIASYDRIAAELVRLWAGRNQVLTKRLDAFCRCVVSGGRILDLGCGFGRDVAYFTKKGFRVVGIDASGGMLRQARPLYGAIPLVRGDIRRIGTTFKAGVFDGIWCRGVLFHFGAYDFRRIIADCRTLLKISGKLYVQAYRGSGVVEKQISGTDEMARYHLRPKAELVAECVKKEFRLISDRSTTKEAVLVFERCRVG